MNAIDRAAGLFIEAQKLGCDAPTEQMVTAAIQSAEGEVWEELLFALKTGGFEQAAKAVRNWQALNRSRALE